MHGAILFLNGWAERVKREHIEEDVKKSKVKKGRCENSVHCKHNIRLINFITRSYENGDVAKDEKLNYHDQKNRKWNKDDLKSKKLYITNFIYITNKHTV